MQKYIKNVVEEIINSSVNIANTNIILPSKRAAIFVKKEFKTQLNSVQFLPKIISIEDFILDISYIEKVDNLVLLFEFYKLYTVTDNKEVLDTFEIFSNWASILIKDFNEIDSYLIDQTNIFSYLKDINRIENWFKNEQQKTDLTTKYIRFFEQIESYYTKFYQILLEKKIGYQGLQYREAYKNIDTYIEKHKASHYVFMGFNALNTSEEKIIKSLLKNKQATIYFDIDNTLLQEGISATRFIKNYKTEWSYFKNNEFRNITNEFQNEKKVAVIGVPKNVSQIKYASEIISQNIEKSESIALVLANENLLTTTINSLPNNVEHINITMGLPLKNILYADLFNLLFKLHLNKNKIGNNKKFYFKDILAVLNHSVLKNKLIDSSITNNITLNNLIFIDYNQIKKLNTEEKNNDLIHVIFYDWSNDVSNCLNFLEILKLENNNNFDIQYINRFEQIFNQVLVLNQQYGFIENLEGLASVFKQLLNNETLSFKGNALEGLQIMGMLETRALEFDTVIITSVNEGFLPSGNTNNSFIPFDIKREKGIPTYQEKNSIFSYHFFRLIARAKNVYLLYNTETDDFGSGEKSRFITQLELLKEKLPKLSIKEYIVSPKINNEEFELKEIKKNTEIIKTLIKSNNKGFSPTALTNYIYNPIAFYKQKVLKIYQLDTIEETIAANTLGTVIHKVLEDFYLPFKNKFIQIEDVQKMKIEVAKSVTKKFKKEYTNGDISKGKNLLTFEVSKQFIINFLNQEINLLKQGKQIKIIDLEVDLLTEVTVDGVDFPIKLMGQADRIDILDGVLRIIDYKTGKVEQKHLNINIWGNIIKDHKYSKAFQVLLYAYMYAKMNKLSFEGTKIESGIISFKNLQPGFMKVNKKPISQEDMLLFENELKHLLSQIFDINLPFIENENLPY